MKNKIIILLSIAACLMHAISARASVKKSELVLHIQTSIETTLNNQISISNRYEEVDKSRFRLKIRKYATDWGTITELIPDDNISDQAAEWIKDSIIKTALGVGLYFLDAKSNDGMKENAKIDQNMAREILPTLTNAEMGALIEKRDKLLSISHTFQLRWRALIISTLGSTNVIRMNTDPFSFGRYVEAILHDTSIQEDITSHNGVVNITKAWEPSFIMTAALIYRIDQRLAAGSLSYEAGVKNLISPVYSQKYADKITYKTFDEVGDELKQRLNQAITNDGKITTVDSYSLYKLVWSGFQLQYGSLGASLVSRKVTEENYIIFNNAKTLWDKFSVSNPR